MKDGSYAPGAFDFGLDAAQEARARKLYADSIVFDLLSQHAGGTIFAHYPLALQAELSRSAHAALAAGVSGMQALADVVYWPYEMARLGTSDLIHSWLRESGLTCGTYDIGVHSGGDPLWVKWETTSAKYTNLPWLRYVTSAEEIRRAKRDGVIALYGHCQPVSPVPVDLTTFDAAYSRGLRSFTLTYNRMNSIGVGCSERIDAGLSRYGIDVVRHCNKLGIIVDVSCCSQLTTLDACRHSRMPVTASHSAARALHHHARSKGDEELRAIAATGGVVGIVAAPFILSDEAHPTIERMLDHIDYIASLVGWKHVAIGTDWPIQAPADVLTRALMPDAGSLGFREEDRLDLTSTLIGFQDCRDLPNLARGLVKRGYSDEQVVGILGENALHVFEVVCD